MRRDPIERHFAARVGWLRAAVLGANDGIVSTASLIVGVAAANGARADVLVAAVAGLVAGAMSMAAGEYVSVSSQADIERADLTRERHELATNIVQERAELAQIYIDRGLTPTLAQEVAAQLMQHDALGAHARDELRHSDAHTARPIQAAVTSALAFAVGAALPVIAAALAPAARLSWMVASGSIIFLAVLGALAAKAGGANLTLGAVRVTFWGALAMAATAVIGALFGTVV